MLGCWEQKGLKKKKSDNILNQKLSLVLSLLTTRTDPQSMQCQRSWQQSANMTDTGSTGHLEVVARVELDAGHQVPMALQHVHALLRGCAVHLDKVPRHTQQVPAARETLWCPVPSKPWLPAEAAGLLARRERALLAVSQRRPRRLHLVLQVLPLSRLRPAGQGHCLFPSGQSSLLSRACLNLRG